VNQKVVISIGLLALGLSVALAQRGGGAAPALDPAKFRTQVRDYDRKVLLNPPPMSEAAFQGRVVWLQRCAYCHDGQGQPSYRTIGPWLGKETIDQMKEAGFRAFVEAGTGDMPGYKYALTAQQIGEVMAYLNTVPSSAKPTADQLAGRAPAASNAGE
jgi:mono/diheme cytochrome c family protein